MTIGRGITHEGWINGSVDYNHYFRTHEKIGDVAFETLDTDGKRVSQVAEEVLQWLKSKGYRHRWNICIVKMIILRILPVGV